MQPFAPSSQRVILCFVLFFFSLPAPDGVKGDSEHLKRIPLPPNAAQLPNPIQLHHAKDKVAADTVHHRQSESFQHISKKKIRQMDLEVVFGCLCVLTGHFFFSLKDFKGCIRVMKEIVTC